MCPKLSQSVPRLSQDAPQMQDCYRKMDWDSASQAVPRLPQVIAKSCVFFFLRGYYTKSNVRPGSNGFSGPNFNSQKNHRGKCNIYFVSYLLRAAIRSLDIAQCDGVQTDSFCCPGIDFIIAPNVLITTVDKQLTESI